MTGMYFQRAQFNSFIFENSDSNNFGTKEMKVCKEKATGRLNSTEYNNHENNYGLTR